MEESGGCVPGAIAVPAVIGIGQHTHEILKPIRCAIEMLEAFPGSYRFACSRGKLAEIF